ncbi:hypothetical protein [Brevibacillus reuszeri]|uniref:hypothetical protein n=1 Tax=Brevibacillus reuszeri TaxID=54915 RepID=UPI003D21B986
MQLRELASTLSGTWKDSREYHYFAKDGVFNPKVWAQQPIKITFVLKEANWPNEDVDLVEWIMSEKSSTYWKTWNNIARWSQALLEGGEYPRKVSKSDKTRILANVSFINLKKVPGGSKAN